MLSNSVISEPSANGDGGIKISTCKKNIPNIHFPHE